MTREEAIRLIGWLKCTTNREDDLEAIDMAIESLSQPIVAKHFDIQSGYIYCSPQIAENVKVVVRCKDCRHRYVTGTTTQYYVCDFMDAQYEDDGYCSHGELAEQEYTDAFNEQFGDALEKLDKLTLKGGDHDE